MPDFQGNSLDEAATIARLAARTPNRRCCRPQLWTNRAIPPLQGQARSWRVSRIRGVARPGPAGAPRSVLPACFIHSSLIVQPPGHALRCTSPPVRADRKFRIESTADGPPMTTPQLPQIRDAAAVDGCLALRCRSRSAAVTMPTHCSTRDATLRLLLLVGFQFLPVSDHAEVVDLEARAEEIATRAFGTPPNEVTMASGSASCSTVGDGGASPRSSQIVFSPACFAGRTSLSMRLPTWTARSARTPASSSARCTCAHRGSCRTTSWGRSAPAR